jgi:N-acetyl sugar amidotransferase
MKVLVISTHYPNTDYIYGDVFVHTRLKEYKKYFDVLVVGYNKSLVNDRTYEYEGISVNIVNDLDRFFDLVIAEQPDVIIGHLIQHIYVDFLISLKKPLVIFFHGFETTSWRRRLMNYTSPGDLRYLVPYVIENIKQLSKVKKLVKHSNARNDIKFVFVSEWLREAASHDLKLPINNSTVIPNGINVDLFDYKLKSSAHRKRILLIRSFKAKNYANDLAIEAILKLSKKDFFNDLEITIHGEGYLFKSLTDRVKHFQNVSVNNFYIENKYISSVHERHGIFLCPSRLDSQGVSMCEAMSSGLVPVTSFVGGIPEYCVHNESGFLTKSIDEIVSSIELLYRNEDVFFKMSNEARQSILKTCSVNKVMPLEIAIIRGLLSKSVGTVQSTTSHYTQCTQCVLDTTDDPAITFDSNGVCSYCTNYKIQKESFVKFGDANELQTIVNRIKSEGHAKRYDCILGLSGGIDSTFVAYQAKKFGLRPLIVHFDNGWNSELAVSNIEKTISKLGFELYTLVVQWEEFRDLQLAFLKASVIDIEMITDHAILATLYNLAFEYDINYILSGTNIVTEGILPDNWIHPKADYVHIKAIQKKFVGKSFKTYPLLEMSSRVKAELKGIVSVSLLNYLDYNKENAKKDLIRELDWRDYGGKHYESIFTRFYQGYILPTKFKVDKRKAHFSTLVCSGQLTKEEALIELNKPIYDPNLLRSDYDFVLKKLCLTKEEFDRIMAVPPKPHSSYPIEINIYKRYPVLKIFQKSWQRFKRILKKR